MECTVSYDELAQYAAGDTAPERAQEIKEHLVACEACRHRLEALTEVDRGLSVLRPFEPPARAIWQTRQALSRELRGSSVPEIMTLDEVAAFLRVSVDDLEQIVTDLPAFEVGGKIRIRHAALLEWVEQREHAHARARAESEVAHLVAGLSWEGTEP
jgi:excisionase family DNA binding protein